MEITFCPNCGHQNQPGSRFCEECGCDLIQAARAQQAQQEAQMTQQMQQQKQAQAKQQAQAQQEAQAQQRVQAAKQNMAAQTSFNKPQKPQKQKKSHLGLILGITIPVILIGIAVILILTGVIKLPFMNSGKKLEGTWYEFAATTPEDGLRSLHDLAVLQDKDDADIRLTMTINKDGTGQLIGGEEGSKTLNWTESDDRYTITCDGVIYTGNFENDNEFSMTGNDNVKLQFSQDISHQIPNQIEVTPSPSPSPTPTPTQDSFWGTEPTEAPSDVGDSEEFEDFDDADEDIEDDDTAVDDDTYIFPNSDTEYLTKSDLSGMSKSEINLAKNELYARHGRKFKSKELQEYFDKLLKDYDEIVFIPMSSGLLGTCQTATMLADEYDRKVHVVNNQRISVTQRQSVIDALNLAKNGYSALEIKEILEREKMESSIYITLDTLKYLKKGGRITPAAAAIGTVLRLNPVLQIQGEKLDAYAKARGKASAKKIMLKAMADDMEKRFADSFKKGRVHMEAAYAGNREEAEEWAEIVKEEYPQLDFHMDPLSLSVACHIGYGALAIACSVYLPEDK